MELKLPHNSSQFDATQRVKVALAQARSQIPKDVTIEEERWDVNVLHFAFTAQGYHISGTLEVKDKEYEIQAKLPLSLRLFEGKIKRAIEEQTKAMLGK